MKGVFIGLCATALCAAEPSGFERREQSKRQVAAYLVREAERVTQKAAHELRNRETWENVRAARLEETRDMLGLLPWPMRTPLRARVTGVLDQGAYTVEKIAFESLPKVYVTANLYLPKQRQGRIPGVVYVCGHSFSPYGDKTAYQRHGISFAKNGYACMILDSVQIAEIYSIHHGVMFQELDEWYSRAYTPAGIEVWNAMRAIDYLERRPEIAPNKIGMTGRSGGAAMTLFTAAVDPRVRVAAPIMGISTYAEHLRASTASLHCDCMFPINFRLHDMAHLAALIAPRPLLLAHGKQDKLFPEPGYSDVERMMRALYASYGKPEAFDNIVVNTGHQDSDFLREQAIRWFDRFLLGMPDRKLDMEYKDANPASLAVFAGSPPADSQNHRVHEILTPAAAFRTYPSRNAWEAHRSRVLAALREKVFGAFPERPAPPAWRYVSGKPGDAVRELQIDTEEGITIRAQIRRPRPVKEGKQPGLVYVASDGEDDAAIANLFRAVPSGVKFVVWARGVGDIAWEQSFWRLTQRSAMQIGRTVDSMRLWDVLRAVEVLRNENDVDSQRITILGKGVSGALGLYAAILDPGIHQTILIDPPSSHVQGPYFLGVLRHLDMPEAVAMVAPRRVLFYARMPAAFEKARHIFAHYGQPAMPAVFMSVDAALRDRLDYGFASGY